MIVETESFGVGGEDVLARQGRLVGVELCGVFGCVLHGCPHIFKHAVERAGDECVCIEEADLAIRNQVKEV